MLREPKAVAGRRALTLDASMLLGTLGLFDAMMAAGAHPCVMQGNRNAEIGRLTSMDTALRGCSWHPDYIAAENIHSSPQAAIVTG